MGVNLTPVVVRHPTSLDALRGRTVAVDGNLELYQFLSIMRMRDGRPLAESAVEAVAEVGNPTIVATLTVIVALLPLDAVPQVLPPSVDVRYW